MPYPPDNKCRPRIKLTGGEWYAHAPNNSPMARAYLVEAINFVRRKNEQLKAARRKKAKSVSR